MGIAREGEGRAALTRWQLLCQGEGLALLGLSLHTGRTHQIRVHLQSIGRPILGDREYGWTKQRTLQSFGPGWRERLSAVWPERQMLHAARLMLDHPLIENCELNFGSQPPDDMIAVLEAMLGPIWQERARAYLSESGRTDSAAP